MTSPTGNKWNRAFLLVEAVLTGVIMATGVAMVTRSLTTPLHALTRLQEREALLRLADSTLTTLEREALSAPPLVLRRGVLESPDERYEWTLRITRASDGAGQGWPEDCRAVALTIHDVVRPSSRVTLTSLWPREWVEE